MHMHYTCIEYYYSAMVNISYEENGVFIQQQKTMET
jgi:hypothetical protein